MHFKEWIEKTDPDFLCDEGFADVAKRWAKPMAKSLLPIAAFSPFASPFQQENPMQPHIDQISASNYKVPLSSVGAKLEKIGGNWSQAITQSSGKQKEDLKVKAAIDYAKRRFKVGDESIEVVTPEEYISKSWGNKWGDVKSRASYGNRMLSNQFSSVPDIRSLGQKVVVVKIDQKDFEGKCQYFGNAKDDTKIAICTVSPQHFGNTKTLRHELSHSMQDAGDGHNVTKYTGYDSPLINKLSASPEFDDLIASLQMRKSVDYLGNSHEFTVRLAEMRRWYYQSTKDYQGCYDPAKIIKYALTQDPKKLPSDVREILFIVNYVKSNDKMNNGKEFGKLIRMMGSMLPYLVQNDKANQNIS